ncbi:MAG: ABC transporter substrate-binding protein [Bdellovibrionales bacterium]|nr:ABC transporter substrate-binding protein [Bdellovibrionales bacterium]
MMFRIVFLLTFFLPAVLVAQESLRVGVIQSLSGIAAEDGKTVVQALELAQEELERRGVQIELVVEDDQTIPKNTVSSY